MATIGRSVKLEKSTEVWRNLVRKAVDAAMLDLADHLQRNSPVGASPVNQSLKGGWDVIPARKQRGKLAVLGSVVNRADAARFRIVGRGPGRMPPYGPDSPLGRWASVVGIPAYLVARKVATEGTQRWRDGAQGNILKQDPVTGKFAKGGPLERVYEARLRIEMAKIRI